MDTATVIGLITSGGVGGIIQALFSYLKDRKKNESESLQTDVNTKLAYLNSVIDGLNKERDRLSSDLTAERERIDDLRRRIRELEDELDKVRAVARDMEYKCDDLSIRLKQLLNDTQESA